MSTAITMRSGLYPVDIIGSRVDATAQQALRSDMQQVGILAQAIRTAMAQARASGVDTFAPDSALLAVPVSSISTADLADWFADVIGHPYSAAQAQPGLPDYGALSLAQWSLAVEALEHRAARDASRLPPGAGGGPQHANGAWYVNGERYTLGELFIAVRMGSFANAEKSIADELNTLQANGVLARDLLAILTEMKRARIARATDSLQAVDTFEPAADFADLVIRMAPSRTLADISDYGTRLKGSASYVAKAITAYYNNLLAPPAQQTTISREDYGYTMDEMQALFDTVNADNQVKQIRVQSLENARSTILDGLSGFLKGFAGQNVAVGRNL